MRLLNLFRDLFRGYTDADMALVKMKIRAGAEPGKLTWRQGNALLNLTDFDIIDLANGDEQP